MPTRGSRLAGNSDREFVLAGTAQSSNGIFGYSHLAAERMPKKIWLVCNGLSGDFAIGYHLQGICNGGFGAMFSIIHK